MMQMRGNEIDNVNIQSCKQHARVYQCCERAMRQYQIAITCRECEDEAHRDWVES